MLLLLLLALVAIRVWPRPPLSSLVPGSVAVLDDRGRLMRLALAADDQYRLWTPLSQVSPEFVQLLLMHEDRHFYWHPGVNPLALARAASATYSGGARQGGSTITMQLARLLYHLNTRSPAGKLMQCLRALELELRYSKRELLEAHLNLLPYGGNVQGVGAASLVYFGKTPDRLTLAESLALVLIPQSPLRRTPEGIEPQSLVTARSRLLDEWAQSHPAVQEQAALVRLPLHFGSIDALPFAAPHAVADLIQHDAGQVPIIRSTIDLDLQHLVENQLQDYVAHQRRIGIRNAAAMLVDFRDLRIKAVVGSANFFDDAIQGQVNGTLAKRSPGSALKPFLYALAMDQGLIHPRTVLKDTPVAYGAFSPENFDGRFEGPITAHDALIRSRNLPAVYLASRVAQPSLYGLLKLAGISHLASEQHYGLALALGGGEVTMEELARLYAMLANHGVLHRLRERAEEPLDAGTPLLSPEASFMTLDILRDNPRPDDLLFQQTPTRLPVYWKTGTSWGFHDAWTAGIFGPYVLVVWVGNFDGESNPAFVGVQAAAPLFFRIADSIHAHQPSLTEPAYRMPDRLARVDVCAASGDLPNADCPQTVPTWFIPGKSPIRVSTVHRKVMIDTRTGKPACPPFDPATTRAEVYEFWPSDLERLFAQAGLSRRKPPIADACSGAAPAGAAPQVTSPLNGVTYSLRAGDLAPAANATAHVPLQANADASVETLYWFVDEAFVGSTKPGTGLDWSPTHAGEFSIRVVDDRGQADSRQARVAIVP